MGERTYTSGEIADATDITYRKLDYWMRTGRLTPSIRPAAGSGSQVIWSESDLTLIRRVATLTGMGLSIDNAFDLANRGATLVPITDPDRDLITRALRYTARPDSVLSLDDEERERMLAIADQIGTE